LAAWGRRPNAPAAMGSMGTDPKEKQASQTLSFRPQLDGSLKTESQAKYLSNFFAREDDLTFKEGSVKDVSDRGRAQVVNALMQALVVAFRQAAAEEKAPAATVGAAAIAPAWVLQDVLEQMEVLQQIRARGRPSECLSAAGPLRKLATLPIDSATLKRTKVALELNHDFWKKAPREEVRQMVAVLVRQWRNMYRSEQGTQTRRGPSERSVRNLATDLEECAYSRAPKSSHYANLVQDLLQKLERAPGTAAGLLDGTQRSMDLVQLLHQRTLAGTPLPASKRARMG